MSELLRRADMHHWPQGFTLDVVGIGALNLDYIANASLLAEQQRTQSMTSRIAELVGMAGPPLEWGTERRGASDTPPPPRESAPAPHPQTGPGASRFYALPV